MSTTLSAGAPSATTNARSSGFWTMVRLRLRRRSRDRAYRTAARAEPLTFASPMKSEPSPVRLLTTAVAERPRLAVVPSRTGFSATLCRIAGRKSVEQAPQREDGGKAPPERQAAPAPEKCVRHEAFLFDGRPAVLQPCRDMDLVARRLGCAGHGQAMRQEIPVLGDDIEDAAGHRRRFVAALLGLWNRGLRGALFLIPAAFAAFHLPRFRGIFCFG